MSTFFFFNDTATTEIYTLSLHDALPIYSWPLHRYGTGVQGSPRLRARTGGSNAEHLAKDGLFKRRKPAKSNYSKIDRKSTHLNSSHANISYAVFCLKKKKNNQ